MLQKCFLGTQKWYEDSGNGVVYSTESVYESWWTLFVMTGDSSFYAGKTMSKYFA
jgi:hypothetical protein